MPTAKQAVQRVLLNTSLGRVMYRVPLAALRGKALQQWPGWVERFYEIRVPSATVANETAAPKGPANINIILELLDATSEVDGDVAECGVFRGQTVVPIALYLRERSLDRRVFGLDSFQGFDDAVKVDMALGGADHPTKAVHGFSATSLDLVSNKARLFGVEDRIELLPGYFEQTLPALQNRSFSFVHLDCDLYESYKACLEFFYPRMPVGGVILLDEYDDPPWPGCNKAVDEFLAGKAEGVHEIERDNYIKYFIRKEAGAVAEPEAPRGFGGPLRSD
ncbi:MAG: TylF/MycF/NovP-related O-methyltransferase [Planctomycetota bacterium]|nr:TylF/MycF/NovP-related O-methyltransferase [Planctomycetota bacterium]